MGACCDASVPLHSQEDMERTSGKSTQKAFMFIPYKKLAKLSLNLLKLSCINCRCIKLASRSAIESESSAKAGSRESRGNAEEPVLGVKVWLSRRDVRELGRRGVEGREGGLLREAEVERLGLGKSIFEGSGWRFGPRRIFIVRGVSGAVEVSYVNVAVVRTRSRLLISPQHRGPGPGPMADESTKPPISKFFYLLFCYCPITSIYLSSYEIKT